MFCDQCGQRVPAGAPTCPHCGAQLDPMPLATTVQTGAMTQPVTPTPIQVRFPQAGEMPRGPGPKAYLGAVVLRNLRGTFAGIFAAWFNVPFTVLMAGVGALVGGLAGAVSGTIAGVGVLQRLDALLTWVFPLPVKAADLLPTAGAQIGGIVGAILGAINGGFTLGWMAFVWPWQELYRGDPSWPLVVALGQVVTAVFVGALYVLWSVSTESVRMRVSGARRMSRREAEWLMPIVHECASRLNLRSLPRVLVDDRREVSAHAGIRHIVINQGLLEQLDYDREAIGAVIAHELVHWRDGDAVAMAWAKGVALPLFLLYELADRLLRLARSRPLHFIIRFLFWSVIVTTRYFVIPVQAGVWRQAEFRADAIVAAAGYADGLRRALSYVRRSFDGERSGWDMAVLATHPPTELRLERLETAGRRYPLREDHPLVKALPGWSSASTVHKD